MTNFANFYGTWAHEKLTHALAQVGYENAQITNLEGFMDYTLCIYTDVKGGDLHLVETLDLMSDVLTSYIFTGDDAFGHTKEVCELVTKVDTLLDRVRKYDLA